MAHKFSIHLYKVQNIYEMSLFFYTSSGIGSIVVFLSLNHQATYILAF